MANVKSVSELILDEQKLVTYVLVSKELCIHVNESKTLLGLVVDEIKKKQPNITLNVNFIVSGLLTDNSARTVVCSEADLDVQKSKFRFLFFEHIYSVSQGLSGVDNAATVSINKFDDFPLCTGLIKNNICTKRSSDEIGTLITKSQAAVDTHISKVPPKKEVKEKSKQPTTHNGAEDSKNVVKAQVTKSEPSIKTEVISPKKEKPSTSNGKIKATDGKKPKSIQGFFSKSNSAPALKPASQTQETGQKINRKPEKNKNEDEEMDVDIEDVPKPDIKKEPESAKKDSRSTLKRNSSFSKKEPTSTPKETSKKDNSSKNHEQQESSKDKKDSSLSKIKKTAKVDKKRKRVLHVSDSDSDEDPFADDKPSKQESDDEIPPTPTTSTVKITSGILNPKKRRKVVDKTYTDEDGYILTRKEEIYESCSEEEVEIVKQPEVKIQKENVDKPNKIKTEVSPKDKKAKISKKKISPPQKGKQATMMSFFKKI